ncbi:hypothetical protein GOP47_0010463 [Adiantum capillus-veneris]|uniref:DYW domain-containing protein n=1 Tax=Adiantum capillus-veneris TaxID=13818 RepID=A0A9D4UW20_ADICA|nr:hypothetical protein GOP47_0010463 [Adiantum capillus-veneris]
MRLSRLGKKPLISHSLSVIAQQADKCRLRNIDPFGSHQASEFNTCCRTSTQFPLAEFIETENASRSLDGSIEQQIRVFNGTHIDWPNTRGWDILRGLQNDGGFNQAVEVVDAMGKQEIMVYSVVFSQLLQQCIKEKNLVAGRRVHSLIVGSGCEADYLLGSSLVHMFAVCGSLSEAKQVFCKLLKRNVISWTALIEAYAKSGHTEQAIQVYYELEKLNSELDGHVFVAVLKACSSISTLEHAKHINARIIERGLEFNVYVGSSLINIYAKWGSLDEAYTVFDRLSKGNVVTWSALISGCAENGHGRDALKLFRRMEQEGIEPNEVTFICTLKACSSLAALEQGKHVHFQIVQKGFESNLVIGNSLIDMYSKSGSLDDALIMFDRMPDLDTISWSAILGGYAKHNNYESALHVFESMQKVNVKPNGITYLSLLSACSHVGLFDEGCRHFKCMIESHSVWPTLEHYNAVVDILGRSGYLDEAEDLMETFPFGPNHVGWVSVLDACRFNGDVLRGKRCFDNVVSLDGRSALGYVLMSRIYSQAGLWEDYKKMQELRKCANLHKKPAKAYIEVDNYVHEFIVDDDSHPQAHEIYGKLNGLDMKMREVGYSRQPFIESLLDEEKDEAYCGHSEKLAIAFGLISTAEGTTIRVAKNLRVCTDCHNAVKLISKIELREIIVTDAYRVHHFKDGVCCCKDEYT